MGDLGRALLPDKCEWEEEQKEDETKTKKRNNPEGRARERRGKTEAEGKVTEERGGGVSAGLNPDNRRERSNE